MIEFLPLVLTGIGLTASIVYYANILNNANKTQQNQLETRRAQLYMTLFSTIYNQELWKHVVEIRQWTYTDYDDFMENYGPNTNPEKYRKLTNVWWFFSELGTLVYRDFITLDDCSHLMSLSPLEVWSQFQDAIVGLREHYYRGGSGYEMFEYLAKNMYEVLMSDVGAKRFGKIFQNIPNVDVPSLSEFSEIARARTQEIIKQNR